MNSLTQLLKTVGDFFGVTPANASTVSGVGYGLIVLGLCLLGLRILLGATRASRGSGFVRRKSEGGFTLLELLSVIAIIIVLASLILSGMGYAQQRSASSRAQAEIKAVEVASEGYKTDHGEYVNFSSNSSLAPSTSTNPANYKASGSYLAVYLIGADAVVIPKDLSEMERKALKKKLDEMRNYGAGALSRRDVLSGTNDTMPVSIPTEVGDIVVQGQYFLDPFGYAYGYSTRGDYNSTMDIWSTGGQTANTAAAKFKWITNW